MEIRGGNPYYKDGFDLLFFVDNKPVKPIQLEVDNDFKEGHVANVSMFLNAYEVQQLMDLLWQNGIRPNNGRGSQQQVDALENHLNDMRKIASKKLGVDLE